MPKKRVKIFLTGAVGDARIFFFFLSHMWFHTRFRRTQGTNLPPKLNGTVFLAWRPISGVHTVLNSRECSLVPLVLSFSQQTSQRRSHLACHQHWGVACVLSGNYERYMDDNVGDSGSR